MAPQRRLVQRPVRAWNGRRADHVVRCPLCVRSRSSPGTISVIGRCAICGLRCGHEAHVAGQRREAIVVRPLPSRSRRVWRHDGPRRGGGDGDVVGAHPPLLRVDGRRAGGGVRAGRARRTSPCRLRDGARPSSPVEALRSFFRTYTPADKDWAFQLWLDAWAEAARRPAVQATSRRLNLEWQAPAGADDPPGRRRRVVRLPGPSQRRVAILSLLDGLAFQVVAHGTTVNRDDVCLVDGVPRSSSGWTNGTLTAVARPAEWTGST